jgi:hypothetical protein
MSISSMIYVLVRTYYHSKQYHVYKSAIILLMYPIFDILYYIFQNYEFGCSSSYYSLNTIKCPGDNEPVEEWK